MNIRAAELSVNANELSRFAAEIFTHHGLSREESTLWADVLVWADLRGVSSHGVMRIPSYIDHLNKGEIHPRPSIRALFDAGGLSCLECDRAPGPVAMLAAANVAKKESTGQEVQFRFPPPLYLYGTIPWTLIKPIENIGDTSDGIIVQAKLHDNLVTAHIAGALLMVALMMLHIGGVLKHQLFDRQPQLARMGVVRSQQE